MRDSMPLQVVVDEVLAIGKTEVVEEAILDRRADVVLGSGKEVDHRSRHQVSGAVAEHLEASARLVLGVGRLPQRRRRRSRLA